MSDKDGGQAFPIPAGNFSGGEMFQSDTGMTMRQWYKGMCGRKFGFDLSEKSIDEWTDRELDAAAKIMALLSGKFADAMIAEDEEFRKREGK